MSKYALYHDHDELKCEVVREAIKAGAITDGEVVCGDIKQLAASDVRGFRRAHFFCGGGFWDLALNLARWGDDPVWTGSCPCPSFSAAGKGGGFDDPRHLWPDWFQLLRQCRPPVVFGEQADDAVGYGWLDLVQTDLEAQAYAVGKIVFGAHSVGAPHIRQRLYFVADTASGRHDGGRSGISRTGFQAAEWSGGEREPERLRDAGDGSHPGGAGLQECQPPSRDNGYTACSPEGPTVERGGDVLRTWRGPGWLNPESARSVAASGATRGFWADCDWWHGRDGKFRPAQSKLLSMADVCSSGLGCFCNSSESESEEATENLDAPQTEAGPDHQLCRVWSETDPKQGYPGPNGFPQAQVLQSRVYGERSDRANTEDAKPQPGESAHQDTGALRSMREAREARSSSQRKPAGQFTRELAEFVRLVPPSITLAKLHGNRDTEIALSSMLTPESAARFMPSAPQSGEAVWRSLDEESKDRLRLGFEAGGFLRVGEPPLAHGSPARVGRLRMYGDAIVVSQAQAFIEAYKESRGGR